jgi:salicylate hydroxylase
MPQCKPHVVIAGAGIGGLTAALALLRSGIDCDIYEQAAELREVGAGLGVSPNGVRVLFALGLEADAMRDGVSTDDRIVRLWNTGQTWSTLDPNAPSLAKRFGAPTLHMHRSDLHAMLVAAVRQEKADAIHVNSQCVGFKQDQELVTLDLKDGRQIEGDILVGADGIHSAIRQALFGADAPKYTGIMAWRGLALTKELPEHLSRRKHTQWLGPSGHVTCYPVRRGELLNMVGEIERSDWQSESWVQPGSLEECLQDFEGWHEDLQIIIRTIDQHYKWGLHLRKPLPTWSVGRATLLGDACHAMLPFLGQGANMAIEDAFVLARCISQFHADPVHALQRFEGARQKRASDIVSRSAAMAETFHNDELSDSVRGAEYITTQWSTKRVGTRFDDIYGYDATTVPV